jgi:hypothetical protein
VLESAEVRPSRQRSDVRHGFNRMAGTVGFQLSLQDYDDMIEYVMGGAWAVINVAGTPNLGADGTGPDFFSRAAGSFVTDGFRPGDIIVTTGFTNGENNGTFQVTAVSATQLTIAETTLVTETEGTGKTLQCAGQRIDIGTTLKTISLERQFQDLTLYQIFRGVAINQMNLSITPDAMIGGTFDMIGMSSAAISGSSVAGAGPTAAADTAPFAAFDGTMFEGGAAVAVATALDLTINNQRSLEGVIGSKYSPDVFDGTAIATGSVSVFLEDSTIFNKFHDETESSIWIKMANGADFINLVLHRVKYTGANMDPGQEGPVTQVMPFEAIENTTYGTAVSFQRSNA